MTHATVPSASVGDGVGAIPKAMPSPYSPSWVRPVTYPSSVTSCPGGGARYASGSAPDTERSRAPGAPANTRTADSARRRSDGVRGRIRPAVGGAECRERSSETRMALAMSRIGVLVFRLCRWMRRNASGSSIPSRFIRIPLARSTSFRVSSVSLRVPTSCWSVRSS